MMKKTALWLIDLFQRTGESVSALWNIAGSIRAAGSCEPLPKSSDSCTVLGTLRTMCDDCRKGLSALREGPVYCLDDFVLSEHYLILKPTHYVYIGHQPEWAGLPMPREQEQNGIYAAIMDRTAWNMTLILPLPAENEKRRLKQLFARNPHIRLCFVNTVEVRGLAWLRHICYKKGLGVPSSHDPLAMAVYAALQSGHKEIIVLGAEASWLKNLRITSGRRIYLAPDQSDVSSSGLASAFCSGPGDTCGCRMHELFDAWSAAFFGYILLSQYASNIDARIFNACSSSFIDAFDRVDVQTLNPGGTT